MNIFDARVFSVKKVPPLVKIQNSSDGATPESVLGSLMYELRAHSEVFFGEVGGGGLGGELGLSGCSDIRLKTA